MRLHYFSLQLACPVPGPPKWLYCVGWCVELYSLTLSAGACARETLALRARGVRRTKRGSMNDTIDLSPWTSIPQRPRYKVTLCCNGVSEQWLTAVANVMYDCSWEALIQLKQCPARRRIALERPLPLRLLIFAMRWRDVNLSFRGPAPVFSTSGPSWYHVWVVVVVELYMRRVRHIDPNLHDCSDKETRRPTYAREREIEVAADAHARIDLPRADQFFNTRLDPSDHLPVSKPVSQEKVSHYQNSTLYCTKNRQWGYIFHQFWFKNHKNIMCLY